MPTDKQPLEENRAVEVDSPRSPPPQGLASVMSPPGVHGEGASQALPTALTSTEATRTNVVDDQTMRKIWTLTGQLSAQLSRNSKQTDELAYRLEERDVEPMASAEDEQHAYHIQCLEADNQRLRERNHLLNEEAHELARLLREHEAGLETILDKFRTQALSVQAATMSLRREHRAQLDAEQCKLERAEGEISVLRQTLAKVTTCLRTVLAEEAAEDAGETERLGAENDLLREMLHISEEGPEGVA